MKGKDSTESDVNFTSIETLVPEEMHYLSTPVDKRHLRMTEEWPHGLWSTYKNFNMGFSLRIKAEKFIVVVILMTVHFQQYLI